MSFLLHLEQANISVAEWYILASVGYGSGSHKYLLDDAVMSSRGDSLGDRSDAELEEALYSCIRRGFLQTVTEASLAKIRDELESSGIYGPLYGMPEVGDLDFTESGVRIYLDLKREGFSEVDDHYFKEFCYGSCLEGEQVFCSESEKALREKLLQCSLGQHVNNRSVEYVSHTEPQQIGKWCVKWWERFDSGFASTVTFRRRSIS